MLFLCLGALCPALLLSAADMLPGETIRVAIVKNATRITIDGDGIIAVSEGGQPVAFNQPAVLSVQNSSISLEGRLYRRLLFSSPSSVLVNGKPYRPVIEISVADKALLVVNELPLEEYLTGLINCEISSSWPIEAVKAQAVIARTYALNRKELRKKALYHLESSVMDQVYDGCLIEDSRARRGVMDTAGEVLMFNGTIIQAFYHSNCGGRTESSENAWGLSIPYLKGLDCKYCLVSPSTVWEQRLSLRDIEEKLAAGGHKVQNVSDIRPGGRNNRGRLRNVVVVSSRGEISLGGEQFRKAVGYAVIKSTNFTVRVSGGEAFFSGAGNGHGVGLCQWGMKQRALEGFNYREILLYYYPNTELKQFSDNR